MRIFWLPLLAITILPQAYGAALTDSEVRACNAMAASFGQRKVEFEALSSRRDALVISVEEAGDTWEAAEALRNFSADHAAHADGAKTAYDDLVAEFDSVEVAYRATGTQLNDDFSAYNAKCASEE